MTLRHLFLYFSILFLGINSFAISFGFDSNVNQVFINFESWKTSPILNVNDMILTVQKIDPDPYGKKFQKVFMFVHKNDLTLSYTQIFLQCLVDQNTAEKIPVLLMSQYGVMDFATISNRFNYTVGMSTQVVMNVWAQIKTYAQIKSEANPCSDEFEYEYRAYRAENLKQNPFRNENFLVSADDKNFYFKLDKFFEVKTKSGPNSRE